MTCSITLEEGMWTAGKNCRPWLLHFLVDSANVEKVEEHSKDLEMGFDLLLGNVDAKLIDKSGLPVSERQCYEDDYALTWLSYRPL